MLELSGIGRRYRVGTEEVTALAGIDLAFPAGSFTTLVGRSGCGKTTLLRILAGLERPSEGEIRRGGDGKLRTAVVFQEARLMPWLDVAANVGFGLRGRIPRAEAAKRCAAAIELVGLSAFAGAMPAQLSGGMAQRVAIARALVQEPDLLLLDEPFAALDAFTRRTMQNELVSIWQRRRPTIVFVTHDVEEAVLLGERALEMQGGRIVGREAIALPYPRDPTDPEVNLHRRAILSRLMTTPAPVPA